MRLAPIGITLGVLWGCGDYTQADFCSDVATAQCRKLFTCLPNLGVSEFGTEERCEGVDCSHVSICDRFDPAKAHACVDAVDAVSCDALSGQMPFVTPSQCVNVCADP